MKAVIIFFVFLLNYVASKDSENFPERKEAFTNDPIELKPVYHTPNKYEERSYDFWYENWPHPHVHGDKPLFDERHQHFPGYGDNYDFSNFITDPPTQFGAKSETVLEETSLVDEPVEDKSVKKPDSSDSNSDEDPPKKSIDQPKKDYESPSEPSISGEKLSKPISNLPAEGNDNEGDPYSALSSSVSSSSKYTFSSGSSSSSSGAGAEEVYPERPKSPSSASSSAVAHQSGYPDSASESTSGTGFGTAGSSLSGRQNSGASSRSGSKPGSTSSSASSSSASDYSDFDSVSSSSLPSSSSSVNTETSRNPSKSRDVYSSSSSSSSQSAQGTSSASSSSSLPNNNNGAGGGPFSSTNNGGGQPEGPPPSSPEDAYNTKPSVYPSSPSSSSATSQTQTHSQIASITPKNGGRGGSEDEYFKSPPGIQPEVFPISKPDTYTSQRPKPTSRVDEFFPEETAETEAPRKPLSPKASSSESESESSGVGGGGEESSSGPRSCCPCCRNENLTPAISPGAAGGGCGAPQCGPPPIVGRPPNCCQQAPLPCCPTISLNPCCLPQLPCCPRIQLTCCPPIQICCQPLNFGCSGGCRSKAVTRLRTKRNGCVPCLQGGRKKREIEAEEAHIRQKRLGCIPCLAREKRQTQQPNNCQKCNPFQQHIVRRVKRTFSCSSCATHRERVKRQSQIADFFRGNQLGNYGNNCQQCYDLPLPTRAMKKRSSGFTDSQHNFLARIKRATDGYDPLFQCDSGCCDYEKCIKSKPLRSNSFKVPEDSDFISDTSSKDYELPDLKEEKSSSSSSSSDSGKKEELIGSKDALSLGGSSSRGGSSDDRSFRS